MPRQRFLPGHGLRDQSGDDYGCRGEKAYPADFFAPFMDVLFGQLQTNPNPRQHLKRGFISRF